MCSWYSADTGIVTDSYGKFLKFLQLSWQSGYCHFDCQGERKFQWRLSPKTLLTVLLVAEHAGKANCSAGYYCSCCSGVDYCCLRNVVHSGLLSADIVIKVS